MSRIVILTLAFLAGCGAIADKNLRLAFVTAYDKVPEFTGSDTYRIEASAIFGPFDAAQPSIQVLTDAMRASLAKAGQSAGYKTMQIEGCTFKVIRRPSGHGTDGACTATMYREALRPARNVYAIDKEVAAGVQRRKSYN